MTLCMLICNDRPLRRMEDHARKPRNSEEEGEYLLMAHGEIGKIHEYSRMNIATAIVTGTNLTEAWIGEAMDVSRQGLLMLERSDGSQRVCPEHVGAYLNIVIALQAEKLAEKGGTKENGGQIEMDANDGMRLIRRTGFVKAMQFVYEDTIGLYLGSEDRHNVARKLIERDTGRCISWTFVLTGRKRATPSTAMLLLVAVMARNTWLDAAHAMFPEQFRKAGGCARSRKTQKRLQFGLAQEGTKHVVSPTRPTK